MLFKIQQIYISVHARVGLVSHNEPAILRCSTSQHMRRIFLCFEHGSVRTGKTDQQ